MKNSIYKIVITAILGLGALSPLATNYTASHAGQTINLETKILQSLDSDKMYDNIEHLSKTPRVAGTKQEDAAVAYIEKQFESYGYETEIQTFTFSDYTTPHTVELALDHYSQKINPLPFEYSANGVVSAEVLPAGLGKADELENLDLRGKIALLQRGEISFVDKISNAIDKGAVGVIIYNNADGTILGSLGEENKADVPAVLLTKAEGEALANHLKKQPETKASLKIEGAEARTNTSHNVIATKKADTGSGKKNPANDILVISSHHDSVAKAPGANDNASGTAMTMELARVLKNIPTSTEIRFITFGAEEVGLIGSTHYVEHLPKNEISRIVANFNLDMVGSKDAGELILQTIDKKPNLVTELAQESSKKLNGEPTPYNQGDSSDHVPFAKAGIPAALFIHNPAEPWYHTADDSIDKISKKKLQDVAEIVSIAVWNQIRIEDKVK